MNPDDLFTRDKHLSSLSLELYLLDELDPSLRRSVLSHVESCASCSARLQAMRDQDDAFLSLITLPASPPSPQTPTPSPEPASPPNRSPSPPSSPERPPLWRRPAFAVGALLCVALLGGVVAMVASSGMDSGSPTSSDSPPRLSFDLQSGTSNSSLHTLSPTQPLQANDVLRWTATPKDPGYLVVVSADRDGAIRTHYPAKGTKAVSLDGDGEPKTLDVSVRARDLLQTKRVAAVYCRAPFKVSDMRSTLSKALRASTLPKTLSWSKGRCALEQVSLFN